MNKKILNLMTALVMLIAFFMPWINFMGFGGSPYQVIKEVFKNFEYVDKEPAILLVLLLLIFPVCAIGILYHYFKDEIKKKKISTIRVFKKSPLIFIIIVIVYGLTKMGDSAEMLLDNDIFEVIGAGLILTIISSIVLFFNTTEAAIFSQNTPQEKEEPKEEANTDDLSN